MIEPLPGQGEGLSTLHLGSFPDHCNLCGLIIPHELADKESIFLVVKSDTFKHSFEANAGGIRVAIRQDYLVRL